MRIRHTGSGRKLGRWAAAALFALAAGAAHSEPYFSISHMPPILAGSSFTLWLEDDAVPAGGFTDADLWVQWDPTVLTLDGWSVDPAFAFGVASVLASPDYSDPTDHWLALTITRDTSAPVPGSFGAEIVKLDFTVAAAATGTTTVNVYPAFAIAAPGYYSFDAVGAEIALAPVPEPATVALLLAGLGVVGAAARRRCSA